MTQIRRSDERGQADHGWLDTRHTFSFADYHDPAFMGFRSLRVINEDRVRARDGFPTHGHRDMEIVSWVVEGVLEHRDSLGHGSVIRPGDVQRMSAGTGVRHSEYNPSPAEPVHFLQIWILPARTGLPPEYEQRHLDDPVLRNRLGLIASPDGRDGSVTIHQDAAIHAARLDAGHEVLHTPGPGRHAWVQVITGQVTLNGHEMAAGDGAAASDETELILAAGRETELLLFDLA